MVSHNDATTDPIENPSGTHALIIRPCGLIEDVILPDDDEGRGALYLDLFGGDFIDVLPINRLTETECIVGDHSLVNGSPINMPANLWLVSTGRYFGLVCGPVLVLGTNLGGDLIDVPCEVRGEIPDFRNGDPRPVLRMVNPILAEKFDAAAR